MKNGFRTHREAADLSQDELAEAVDVTRQIIDAVECRQYDPSLELASKLAAYLDCRTEDLFDSGLDTGLTT